MAELFSVEGDPNDHVGGALIAANPKTVKVNGKPVIEVSDPAAPDSLCPASPHCNPASAEGSSTVFVYGNPAHRNNDKRVCDGKTIVIGQSNVFVGG